MNASKLECIRGLVAAGIEWEDAEKLRRCAMTLHRWAEMECGDGNDYASWAVERDDETGKPYFVTYPHSGQARRRAIPDREKGALRRVAGILRAYPGFAYYHQGDPRGASLYILRPGDIPDGASADSCYNRGVAVYK